jgi:hypothetical protein
MPQNTPLVDCLVHNLLPNRIAIVSRQVHRNLDALIVAWGNDSLESAGGLKLKASEKRRSLVSLTLAGTRLKE